MEQHDNLFRKALASYKGEADSFTMQKELTFINIVAG
jgi:hypothetical protein